MLLYCNMKMDVRKKTTVVFKFARFKASRLYPVGNNTQKDTQKCIVDVDELKYQEK